MRKVTVVLGLCLLFGMTGMAQERKGGKMKELRKAFLTEELSLKDEEAVKFWPLYEAHKENKRSTRSQLKSIREKLDANESISESELLTSATKVKELKIQELNMDHQFMQDILPILGVKRTMDLRKLERKFKMKMKEKRGERPGGEGPRNGQRRGQP